MSTAWFWCWIVQICLVYTAWEEVDKMWLAAAFGCRFKTGKGGSRPAPARLRPTRKEPLGGATDLLFFNFSPNPTLPTFGPVWRMRYDRPRPGILLTDKCQIMLRRCVFTGCEELFQIRRRYSFTECLKLIDRFWNPQIAQNGHSFTTAFITWIHNSNAGPETQSKQTKTEGGNKGGRRPFQILMILSWFARNATTRG